MSAVLLETNVDERATLEAAFALIDGDDWRADALFSLDWLHEARANADNDDNSDAISSSDSSAWLSEEANPVAVEASEAVKREQADDSVAADLAQQVASVAKPAVQATRSDKQLPVRRMRVGDRKKEELARLRADVKVLQARADFLERRRIASRFDNGETGLVAVATRPTAFRIAVDANRAQREVMSPLADLRLVGVWKDVAERQRHRRTASEVENMRLRALVKGQQRTVKNLKAILQRQAALQKSRTATPGSSISRIARGNFSPAEVAKLCEMWEGLDYYYLATDYAFQLNGLAMAGYSPVMATQITPLSATTTLIEVTGNGLFPLGYRETTAVLWRFALNSFSCDDTDQHRAGLEQCGVPIDGSSVVRTYSLDQRIGKLQVALHGSHASRKYIEQHRTATVYSGVARLVEIQGKSVAGITTSDRGRVVISDVPSATGSLCLCQASNKVVVEIDSARLDETVHLNALTDFFVGMKIDIYDRIREGVESAALGRAPTRGTV